jgi:hypothetical protein
VKFIIENYLRSGNAKTGLDKNAKFVAGTAITAESD